MLTNQEIFDAAWKQAQLKKKCVSVGTCLYRKYNEDGTCDKCFIGAAIPDELYDRRLEQRSGAYVLAELGLIDSRQWLMDIRQSALVSELQRVHDIVLVEYWNIELSAIAAKYSLTVPV